MNRWGFSFPLGGIPLSAHREVLQQAEAMGYTDAWTPEVAGADAFVPLALAAAWTDSLRLGTGIANVFTRGPALLAMTAAALEEAAPGRFSLGLGTSSPAIVEDWNGFKLERPMQRLEAIVAFLRQAIGGERASSEVLGVSGFRLERRFPTVPPIFAAALRQKMLALAGRTCDGVIVTWISPADVPKMLGVAREAAKAAGRDPDALEMVCSMPVLSIDEEEPALRLGRRLVAAYLTTPIYAPFQQWLGRGEALAPVQEAWEAGDRRAAVELVPDDLVDDLLLFGNKKKLLDRIEAFVRNGVTVPVVEFTPTAQDPEEQAAQSLAMMKELAR